MTLEQNQTKRRKCDRVVEGYRLLREAEVRLTLENDYKGACKLLREGIDLYSHHACWQNFRHVVGFAAENTTQEEWTLLEREAEEGSASAQFYLGYIKTHPFRVTVYHHQNNAKGDFLIDQACTRGHGYALYIKGGALYRRASIVDVQGGSIDRALEMWERAEAAGVSDASNELSNHWYSFKKNDPQHIEKAMRHAFLGHRLNHSECTNRLNLILEENPRETTPWSVWSPSSHWACASMVKEAIFTWLLISKRTDLPKGVILIICEFVCTETTNEKYCDKWPL